MADETENKGMNRRDFVRKAAITGAVAAWAVPVIQTVSATPAFATTNGSPPPGGCWHSIEPGKPNGCMETCKAKDDICGPPDGVCAEICNAGCTLPENACPPNYCNINCWQCVGTNPVFTNCVS